MRKTPTIEQQHAMHYENASHSGASLNMSKSGDILRNVCFLTKEDEVNLMQSSTKLIRQSSKEQTIAPKKNLPHKKRITKKLKSISPNLDQMQAVDATYHSHHHDLIHLQTQHEHSFSISNHQQNETLNLTLNQQPIQLTTPRVTHHNQTTAQNQGEYMASDHFSNSHTNGLHSVQMQQIPETITETQSRFTCEICGMQSESQLGFFHHLKLHYEPEPMSNTEKIENIRGTNITNSLAMDRSNQNIFEMNDERKMSMPDQSINQPVILSGNFSRIQNNEQDFSCISGIGNEDVTDDESMGGYNDTALTGIKSEQNEFSDTEDMLENGVLDKVQRVVDSYIENGTSDVKNLISMNENQHHSNLVDNWNAANSHTLASNGVYDMEKSESVNNFVITSNNQHKEPPQTSQSHIKYNQPVIERPEELTLIYEINVNDKDFPIMDDNSAESK